MDYAFWDEWIHRRSADSKAAWFKVVASAVEPRMRDSISASIFQGASYRFAHTLPRYLASRLILMIVVISLAPGCLQEPVRLWVI